MADRQDDWWKVVRCFIVVARDKAKQYRDEMRAKLGQVVSVPQIGCETLTGTLRSVTWLANHESGHAAFALDISRMPAEPEADEPVKVQYAQGLLALADEAEKRPSEWEVEGE